MLMTRPRRVKNLPCGFFEGNTMKHYALGPTDRQTDRYRAMSHAGMTTVWPPRLSNPNPPTPQQNSHTCQSTQAGLDGTPASAQLLPVPSKYHVPTCTHINIQTHTHTLIGTILPGLQLEQIQEMSMTATITHQGSALLV